MSDMQNDVVLDSTNKTSNHLLSDTTFNKLRDIQETIKDETGVIVKLQKLIDSLLTEERLMETQNILITKLREAI